MCPLEQDAAKLASITAEITVVGAKLTAAFGEMGRALTPD